MNLSELPPRCLEICPAVNQEGIADYPLCFTRNCKGPESSHKDITNRVEIHKNGDAYEFAPKEMTVIDASGETRTIQFVNSAAGQLVCRNVGLNKSIDALLAGAEV